MTTDEKLRELSAALSNEHRLERENAKLRAALSLIDNFAWSALTADCEEARVELNRRVQVCREALK